MSALCVYVSTKRQRKLATSAVDFPSEGPLVFGNEWALCVRSKSLSLALWPATKSDGTFQKEACATFSFLDLSKNRCCCEKNKQSWVWHWEPIVTLLRAPPVFGMFTRLLVSGQTDHVNACELLFFPIFRFLPPTLNTPQTAINDRQCNTECCALIYKAKQTSHREEYWQPEQSVTSLFTEVNRNNHSKSSWKALIWSLPGGMCKISGLKSHKLQL